MMQSSDVESTTSQDYTAAPPTDIENGDQVDVPELAQETHSMIPKISMKGHTAIGAFMLLITLAVGTVSIAQVNTAAAYSGIENVNHLGVVTESSKRKQSVVLKVSAKGQRAIGAFIIFLAGAAGIGIYIGFRISHSYMIPALSNALASDACNTTLYPALCNSILLGTNRTDPPTYVSKSMATSVAATNESLLNLTRCQDMWPSRTGIQYSTLQMCVDMYQNAIGAMSTSLQMVNSLGLLSEVHEVNDLEQLMSSALTYHFTCLDGLQEQGLWTDGKAICGLDTERTTELMSNALSLVDRLIYSEKSTRLGIPPSGRRLLGAHPEGSATSDLKWSPPRGRILYAMDEENLERFPTWLNKKDRHLLQSTNNFTATSVTVALDGSGDYTSIQSAINNAPSDSIQRHVIYIKNGTYVEQVTVPKGKNNLTFLGDGAGVTIITGNISVAVHNVTAQFTATVTVLGDGFIAKNLTIRNTAGPNGHQAVALRVTSHQSAFAWLSIEGYQGTLYAHTNQQFYSYCTVFGTVDSIFGSAAAVFQSCTLSARLPNPGQNITYTASGIASPLVQKHAGLVFHSCAVDAASELIRYGTANFPTFLGRPWKEYARTIFIKSKLGQLVSPEGWIGWDGTASSTTHVDYGEFENFGPGAEYTFRVPWSKLLSHSAVQQFSVDNFIKGNQWLPALNITYSGSI